jgi:hypothetical protein
VSTQVVSDQQSLVDSDGTSESDGELSSDAESENHQVVSSDDTLRLCRNSLFLDSKTGSFRFAHPSVREYGLEENEIKTTHPSEAD